MKGTRHHRIRTHRNRDTGWRLVPRNPRCRNAGATSGYRSYSPELGRWINRDPIQEDGGHSLSAMVTNGPRNHVDSLGVRFHSPELGRRLNQHPLGEEDARVSGSRFDRPFGKVAKRDPLYLFVRNRPTDRLDILGLKCGSWLSDWFIPDHPGGNNFEPACEFHDNCYGDCSVDKGSCDQGFRKRMEQSCTGLPTSADGWCWDDDCIPYAEDCWVKCTVNPQARCMKWAKTYYNAVRKLGCGPYKKAQKKSGCCPRNPPCS